MKERSSLCLDEVQSGRVTISNCKPFENDGSFDDLFIDLIRTDDFYYKSLFPLYVHERSGISQYPHNVKSVKQDGDCLFSAVILAAKLVGKLLPEVNEMRKEISQLIWDCRNKCKNDSMTLKQYISDIVYKTYWLGDNQIQITNDFTSHQEILDAVQNLLDKDEYLMGFNFDEYLETNIDKILTTSVDSESNDNSDSQEKAVRIFCELIRTENVFAVQNILPFMAIGYSINIVLYTLTTEDNIWNRTYTLFVNIEFPTIVLVYGRCHRLHYEAVEWGFGDPKTFLFDNSWVENTPSIIHIKKKSELSSLSSSSNKFVKSRKITQFGTPLTSQNKTKKENNVEENGTIDFYICYII